MKKQFDYELIERKAKRREVVGKSILYVLLTFWALVVLFPFYWMLLSSVKSYSAYSAEYIPRFYTLTPTFENYVDAFTAVPLGQLTTAPLSSRISNSFAPQ